MFSSRLSNKTENKQKSKYSLFPRSSSGINYTLIVW